MSSVFWNFLISVFSIVQNKVLVFANAKNYVREMYFVRLVHCFKDMANNKNVGRRQTYQFQIRFLVRTENKIDVA